MENLIPRTELFTLLHTFSKAELRKFQDFLGSPYFNKSRLMLRLFGFIKQFHPDYDDAKLTYRNIHNCIYPERKYNYSTLRHIVHELNALAIKFLTVQKMPAISEDTCCRLLSELNSRKLNSLSRKYLRKLEPCCSPKAKLSTSHLLNMFKLKEQKLNESYVGEVPDRDWMERSLLDYNRAADYLFAHYLSNAISFYVNLLILKYMYGIEIKDTSFKRQLESIDLSAIKDSFTKDDFKDPVSELSFLLLDAFEVLNDDGKYETYKSRFEFYADRLSHSECSQHTMKLISYCILKLNRKQREKHYELELFSIYDHMLEKGLYKDDTVKYIPNDLFRDMLMNGLEMGNYNWTYKLLSDHCDKLCPAEKEDMLNYGSMYYNFYLGSFGSALENAQKISKEHFVYKFDVYNLQVKIFYEQEKYDSLLCLIKSYTDTLSRCSITPEDRKERYKTFLTFVKALTALRMGSKKLEAGMVRKKIEDTKEVSFKDWLIQKLDEIEGKGKKIG